MTLGLAFYIIMLVWLVFGAVAKLAERASIGRQCASFLAAVAAWLALIWAADPRLTD